MKLPSLDPVSCRSWGFFLLIGALLMSMAPALGGDVVAKGFLAGAVFSFAAWGAARAGRPGLGVALFLLNFAACAATMRATAKDSDLFKRQRAAAEAEAGRR